jgi:hypothetical protein
MKLTIFISLLSLFTINLFYGNAQQDSCLKLFCSNNYSVIKNMGSYNPDSVKVDTCSESQTFGKIYANRFFELKFTQYPFDTAIVSGVLKGVNDLRNDIPGLKQQFQDLEQEFGNIYFARDYPFVKNPDDSICRGNGIVFVIFENYQDVEYIKEIFTENIDSLIDISYITRYGFPLSMPSDIGLKPTTKLSEIYQNFKQDRDYDNNLWYDFYPINYEPYGFQSNIYEVNCPMAWEITKGTSNIIIGFSDLFSNEQSLHPDILQNYFLSANTGNGYYWNLMLLTGHAIGAVSNSVAIENNQNNIYPMIGTSPHCMAISFPQMQSGTFYDLDGIKDYPDKRKYIDVKNCSYGAPSNSRMVNNDIDAGIVVVAAAGNDRAQLHGGEENNKKAVPQPDGSYELQPSIMNPAASVYTNANPDLDYRIISVGATQSGFLRNKNCDTWGVQPEIGPNFSSDIQFVDSWNFSEGINKFSINSNSDARRDEKEKAFVDLVAPGKGILCASEGEGYDHDCDDQFTF